MYNGAIPVEKTLKTMYVYNVIYDVYEAYEVI